MTTLFGGWEPQIIPQPPIIIPQEIPADPIINIEHPVLTEPVSHITQTQRLTSLTGDKTLSSRISDCGIAYTLKDGQIFSSLTLTDHVCDGHSGLMRVYSGIVGDKLTIDRVSHLRGQYSRGVCAGVLHMGSIGARIKEVVLRNCNYESEKPITSPGDVYAGILTAGGKPLEPKITVDSILVENCRSRNTFVDYSASSDPTAYPNRDVVAVERTVGMVNIRNVDFRFGSDAGIDMKAHCRVEAAILEGFRENFKFWEDGQDGDVYTANPRVAHWVMAVGGRSIERIVEFAAIVQNDPTKPIVQFQAQPHKLILEKGYLECDFANQVLATADSGAIGSTVQMGDKSITISKQVTMLSELLS